MQTLPIKIEKKNRVNRTNTTQQKFLQWYIFYPFDKDTDPGLKMWQNLVLFLLAFIVYPSGFDLLSLFNFPNFP